MRPHSRSFFSLILFFFSFLHSFSLGVVIYLLVSAFDRILRRSVVLTAVVAVFGSLACIATQLRVSVKIFIMKEMVIGQRAASIYHRHYYGTTIFVNQIRLDYIRRDYIYLDFSRTGRRARFTREPPQ